MKKFYLFAGALLAAMPMFSQGLVRYPDDPKVIFNQNFEVADGVDPDEAFNLWCNTAVDTIKEITYFNKIATGSVSNANIYDGSKDYEVFMVRKDSIIPLKNGVVTSNNKNDKANSIYANEEYGLVFDGGNDAERKEAFANYGENGGKYYFSYTSADATGADTYSSSNRNVKNYRRNLFVRGLNIEDQSSYRLTFYVKVTPKANVNPDLYTDIMRGYYNSEKPFSMGLVSDADNYQYNNTFEFEKTEFTGNWEKVTYMTYYLNDSIADGYVYRAGYYWYNDWKWRPSDEELAAAGKTLKAGDTLTCINQPDKFFVRLSFSSDSTEFLLDNLSLIKSWIGGVEHHNDMIRVDFGYDTNLKELAAAAESETGIAAVELPGTNFSVYGKTRGSWYPITINSAEYHDDGYMYMWSKPNVVGGKTYPNYFSTYDSVLVSFINPIDDPKMCLKYSGKLFPSALDVEWIKNGKTVHNFTNEVSTPNPNIGKGVYSIKNLPPKFISSPYENGSFGLQSINEITVNYTRKLEYDDKGETSELGWLRVTKAGVKEVWTISESTDSTTTYVRSASDIAKGALSGDYTFEFVNIKGEGTDYGKNATISLGFGDFDHNPDFEAVYQSNFRENSTATQSVPVGTAIWNGKDKFTVGDGTNLGTKSRLFWTNPNSGFDAGFYISGRAEGTDNGHMACGVSQNQPISLEAGTTYTLSFSAAHWETSKNVNIYVYPINFDNVNDIPSISVSDKTLIGSFAPTVRSVYTDIQVYSAPYGNWPSGVESYSFNFTIPQDGNYVIEWEVKKNGTDGILMSDIEIQTVRDLSFPYVSKLNKTVFNALEKLKFIEEEEDGMYLGDQYEALSRIADAYSYENWEDTKPSAYLAAAAIVQAEIDKMQLRMDTVNLFYETEAKVMEKLAEFEVPEKAAYMGLITYDVLYSHLEGNEDWDCAEKTTAEITAEINLYETEIKALDTRMELIGKFDDKVKQVQTAITEATHSYYDEYEQMKNSFETITGQVDKVNDTDDVFTNYYNSLCEAYNNYAFKIDYVVAKTRQIKELYALADTLGYKFTGDLADVKATINALQDDDPALSNVLREAAILQIYKIFAEGSQEQKDSLSDHFDVSALMPNYFLYTEAQVDRDMEKNSSGNWRIKGGANTDIFPGWTFNRTGGNWIPTTVKVGEGEGYMDWENDGHVFISGLRCKGTSQGSLATVVEGLPQALYWVGLYGYNQTSNVSITIKTDSISSTGKLNDLNGGKFNYKEVGKDQVPVAGNLELSLSQTSSSSSEFDMRYFILRLCGADEGFDYAKAAADQQSKVNELILFTDAPIADEVEVQYFSLGGIQIDAPKAGEIVIKRSILSNGESVSEIEMIK